MEILLNTKVKDKITGFIGITTARCEYFTGCVQYEVTPIQLKEGIPQKEQWLDDARLEIMKVRKKVTKRAKPLFSRTRGGPQNTPPRRSHPE